jgi:hypothetical protein
MTGQQRLIMKRKAVLLSTQLRCARGAVKELKAPESLTGIRVKNFFNKGLILNTND